MKGRRRSIALAVLAAFAANANAQATTERATALVADGRYGEAWRLVDAEPDAVERSRGAATVRYAAGDLGGALREAEAGLAHDEAQLDLLFYATSVSLTLGDRERSERYASRFRDAVGARAAPENRAVWEEWSDEFDRRAERLLAGAESKATAITRARVCVAITLVLAIAALLKLGSAPSV